MDENCSLGAADQEICSRSGCSHLCHVVNGAAVCMCRSGYVLKDDKKSCENINECEDWKNYCSQICIDTSGGYTCSCHPGYKLAVDKTSCEDCEPSFWGVNCANQCQCSGHGTCHHIRGCECYPGWQGVDCNNDVDECVRNLHNCSVQEVCQNTRPGFICNCQPGYQKNNSVCSDINECSDILSNNCNTIHETCENNLGSYKCICSNGYTRNISTGQCEDFNECTGQHKCEHVCVNTIGSYFCQCFRGYELQPNRSSCTLKKQLCVDSNPFNCSHVCTLDDITNKPICLCRAGFELQNDNRSCQDIDECGRNVCISKDYCENKTPGYQCKCPVGSRLDNDGRSCINCSSGSWGVNCNHELCLFDWSCSLRSNRWLQM
uniref:EGF-like domain-containing protein n=1 Tax=Biomphalaria glabrata TaxID=6526 RepID=A0A2C9JTQ7_BIOGL